MNLTLSLDSRHTKGILLLLLTWSKLPAEPVFTSNKCFVLAVRLLSTNWFDLRTANVKVRVYFIFFVGERKRALWRQMLLFLPPLLPPSNLCAILLKWVAGENFNSGKRRPAAIQDEICAMIKTITFTFLFMSKQNVYCPPTYFVQRNKEQIAISLLLQLNTINASNDLKTTIISGLLAQRTYLSMWLVCPLKDKV